MGKISQRPKLNGKDIVHEIRNRTAYPKDEIKDILNTYGDIVKETISLGIECAFPSLGFFSYKQKYPKEDIIFWNPKTKQYEEHKNLPGFLQMRFRSAPTWKEQLKEATLCEPWKEKEKKENE